MELKRRISGVELMVGKKIAFLRKQKGLRQEELAQMLEVSPQAVSKWENGHTYPDITLLIPLARILGVSVDELLAGKQPSEEIPDIESSREVKLSICAIVKNEEKRIRSFMDSLLPFADEIIIVDNGSTDATREIITEFMNGPVDVVLVHSDEKFDLARNKYLEKATGDWILNLDTDERLEAAFAGHLKDFLANEPVDVQGVILPCFNYYGGGGWTQWNLPRLIRNAQKKQMNDAIHASYADAALKDGGRLDFVYAPFHHFDAIWNKDQSKKRQRNIPLIEETMKKNPAKSGIYKNLANEYFAMGQYEKGIEILQQGIKLDKSSNSRLYKGLANYYYHVGKYEEALEAAQKQIDLFLPLIKAKDGRSMRYTLEVEACRTILYKTWYAMGKKAKAMDICNKNIRDYPMLPHNYLNRYIMEDKKNFHDYEMAAMLNPMMNNKEIYCEKGVGDLYSFAGLTML